MSYSYTLPAYDEDGFEHQISFGVERELRNDAFLELDVELIRGVVGWREVQLGDLSPKVQESLGR